MIYTEKGPGILEFFVCSLIILLCAVFVWPENPAGDIVASGPAKRKEGKAAEIKYIPPYQVKHILPELMRFSTVEIYFRVCAVKTIEVFVVPVTKKECEVFL